MIICGDLFDRGKEVKELQNFVVDLMQKDEIILIRGNHEDLALDLVDKAENYLRTSVVFTHHFRNGTVNTILALADMEITQVYIEPKKCADRVKNSPYFNTIIPAMKDYYETNNYIFVHGWIPCDALGYGGKPHTFIYKENWRECDNLDWKYARWFNGMEAARQGVIEPNKIIVCGHWHTSFGHSKIEGKGEEFGDDADFSPYYNKGIIAIDGCTALTRKVNVIALED